MKTMAVCSRGSGPYPLSEDIQHLPLVTTSPIHTLESLVTGEWFLTTANNRSNQVSAKGITKCDAVKLKHTHTIAESKWVNLVKKVGPVPLTRFPGTQKLDQKLSKLLYSSAKSIGYNRSSASLFLTKIPCIPIPPFSNVSVLFIEKPLVTIIHTVWPICWDKNSLLDTRGCYNHIMIHLFLLHVLTIDLQPSFAILCRFIAAPGVPATIAVFSSF